MVAPRKYPVELQERAVRLWRSEQPRRPIAHLARELGVHPEALRNWIHQDQANRSERSDRLTSEQLEELRRLRQENPCPSRQRKRRPKPSRRQAFAPRRQAGPHDGSRGWGPRREAGPRGPRRQDHRG